MPYAVMRKCPATLQQIFSMMQNRLAAPQQILVMMQDGITVSIKSSVPTAI